MHTLAFQTASKEDDRCELKRHVFNSTLKQDPQFAETYRKDVISGLPFGVSGNHYSGLEVAAAMLIGRIWTRSEKESRYPWMTSFHREIIRSRRFKRLRSDEACDRLRGSMVLILVCWSLWLVRGWGQARRRRVEKVVSCKRRSRCMAGFWLLHLIGMLCE